MAACTEGNVQQKHVEYRWGDQRARLGYLGYGVVDDARGADDVQQILVPKGQVLLKFQYARLERHVLPSGIEGTYNLRMGRGGTCVRIGFARGTEFEAAVLGAALRLSRRLTGAGAIRRRIRRRVCASLKGQRSHAREKYPCPMNVHALTRLPCGIRTVARRHDPGGFTKSGFQRTNGWRAA